MNLCECGNPLLVRYDLGRIRQDWTRDQPAAGPENLWRYAPVLPVCDPSHIVTLGEGMTPLLRAQRLGERVGSADLWVKDDGLNPTGSFKARGQATAMSMCVELGIRKVASHTVDLLSKSNGAIPYVEFLKSEHRTPRMPIALSSS